MILQDGPDGETERGLSVMTQAALGFGLTILVIAGVGVLLMQLGGTLQSEAPVGTISAEPVDATDDKCCQRVRLTHESGQDIPIDEIDLTVTFSDHDKQARLRGLPTNALDQGDYSGNHVFMLGDGGIGGVADSDDGQPDDAFSAGDVIEFRIAHVRVDLRPGETVQVTVHHTETGTVVQTVNATVD